MRTDDRYDCVACDARYPVIDGIADFRLCSDPYLTIDEDRAKAARLVASTGEGSFGELLRRYYAMTPEVPQHDSERYARHHEAGVERGQALLQRISAYRLNVPPASRLLDVGCGSGGTVVAGAAAGHEAVGVDIAMRWLVVARRRLAEHGATATLVCACADHLPFRDGSFDFVLAENLLEHVSAPLNVLGELVRVRAAEGSVMARVVNRFALAREPHVGLWGAGLLPRPVAAWWVHRRTGAMYLVKPLSYFTVRRMASRIGGLVTRRALLTPDDVDARRGLERRFARLYRWLDHYVPPARPLLTLFGPFLDVVSVPVERRSAMRHFALPSPRLGEGAEATTSLLRFVSRSDPTCRREPGRQRS